MLVENQHTTTLAAQHIIHDHMVYHELASSNLTITAKLLSHVSKPVQGTLTIKSSILCRRSNQVGMLR